MYLHNVIVRTAVIGVSAVLSLTGHAACDVRSGPKTTALIELYTSEGCSSCPRADRQINRVRQILGPSADVVPLALHVNYWDYIGWKDPYANTVFGERQSALVHTNRRGTVYTPQVFISGRESDSWGSELSEQVRQLNSQLAKAAIHVAVTPATAGLVSLAAEATASPGNDSAALYLAITESGMVSKITRGENKGATLEHDYVVREWIGPIPLISGAARMRREIALPVVWNRSRLEIVAFVQDEQGGRVLQALGARRCLDS